MLNTYKTKVPTNYITRPAANYMVQSRTAEEWSRRFLRVAQKYGAVITQDELEFPGKNDVESAQLMNRIHEELKHA